MVCLKIKILFFTASLLFLAIAGVPYQVPVFGQKVSTDSAKSSKPAKTVEPALIRDRWISEDGLPQNSVVGLTQAIDGYLWIGTQEGVTRFDGVNFKTYKEISDWAGQNIFTSALLASIDGSMWVGTREGLNKIRRDSFTRYTRADGLPNSFVTALAEDAYGILWIGTRNGIARLSDGKITPFTANGKIKNDEVTSLLVSRNGTLWFGTTKGLLSYQSDSQSNPLRFYGDQDGFPETKITKLYQDRRNNLWIGTEDSGLYKFSNGDFSALTTRDGLSNNKIFALGEDDEGRLWIGTNNGLDYLKDGKLTNYARVDKTFADQILSIYPDYEGSIWIGTNSNGLMRLRKSKFTVYGMNEGLARNDIWCTLESKDGSIWVGLGAGGGLTRMKDGKSKNWSTSDGLPDSEVLALFEDNDGSMWVGTGNGICQFKNGRFKCYSVKDGLCANEVTSIVKDRDGSLWIGTYSGVSQFKGGQFINSWNDCGLRSNLISDLIVAKNGDIWISGMPDGLFHIRGNTASRFTTSNGLSSNQVTSIYEDSNGDLWVGTYQNGLNRIRTDGSISHYSTKNGLFENQVFDTLEDDFGNFWLTSNHGIFKIAKQQFNDFDQGKINQLIPTRYGISDGLRTEECNGGSQPSGWKTRDGRLLITTIKGLVVFDPKNISNESFFPPVIIEQIIADRQMIAKSGLIQVGPGLHDLEIQYTGLSLLSPTKIQFKYLLEGYDNSWKNAGTRRTAYYTNLPPGTYRFRVIASNSAGHWNNSGAEMGVHVLKHFYQKTWFFLFCAIAAGMAIYGVHRFRISRTNELLLSKVAVSLPTAMAIVDTTASVKMLNNQFVRDFGYTPDDIPTTDQWFELAYSDPATRDKARSAWSNALNAPSSLESQALQREWRVKCKDGSEREVDIRFARAFDKLIVTLNDITFRKRAEEELKTSHEQLRELAARLQQAREEERAFIAREIHDELGQLLTGLKIDIKWLEKRLPANAENSLALKEKTVSILELVDETIVALRRIATELRPGVLDTLGLNAAIEWQAQEFSKRTGIDCEISEQTDYKLKDPKCEAALFRIFQEALTNVARHSEASRVRISLSRHNGSLILQVRDNGRGITDKEMADPHSIGLLGMRERAHVFGGEVKVSGLPNRGTIVTAKIPIDSVNDRKGLESPDKSQKVMA